MRGRFFDQSCDFLRPGNVNGVTGTETSTVRTLARPAYRAVVRTLGEILGPNRDGCFSIEMSTSLRLSPADLISAY